MRKPTVIHIVNNKGRLCGKEFDVGWAARYCNDAFARTLPQCPDCLAVMGIERLELSEPIESVEQVVATTLEEAYSLNKQRSLREWAGI